MAAALNNATRTIEQSSNMLPLCPVSSFACENKQAGRMINQWQSDVDSESSDDDDDELGAMIFSSSRTALMRSAKVKAKAMLRGMTGVAGDEYASAVENEVVQAARGDNADAAAAAAANLNFNRFADAGAVAVPEQEVSSSIAAGGAVREESTMATENSNEFQLLSYKPRRETVPVPLFVRPAIQSPNTNNAPESAGGNLHPVLPPLVQPVQRPTPMANFNSPNSMPSLVCINHVTGASSNCNGNGNSSNNEAALKSNDPGASIWSSCRPSNSVAIEGLYNNTPLTQLANTVSLGSNMPSNSNQTSPRWDFKIPSQSHFNPTRDGVSFQSGSAMALFMAQKMALESQKMAVESQRMMLDSQKMSFFESQSGSSNQVGTHFHGGFNSSVVHASTFSPEQKLIMKKRAEGHPHLRAEEGGVSMWHNNHRALKNAAENNGGNNSIMLMQTHHRGLAIEVAPEAANKKRPFGEVEQAKASSSWSAPLLNGLSYCHSHNGYPGNSMAVRDTANTPSSKKDTDHGAGDVGTDDSFMRAKTNMHAETKGKAGKKSFYVPMKSKNSKPTKKILDKTKVPRSYNRYNIYFIFERLRIIQSLGISASTGKKPKGEIDKDYANITIPPLPPQFQDVKPTDGWYVPFKKQKRPHRKTHGSMNFQDLAKDMALSWKKVNKETLAWCVSVETILKNRQQELIAKKKQEIGQKVEKASSAANAKRIAGASTSMKEAARIKQIRAYTDMQDGVTNLREPQASTSTNDAKPGTTPTNDYANQWYERTFGLASTAQNHPIAGGLSGPSNRAAAGLPPMNEPQSHVSSVSNAPCSSNYVTEQNGAINALRGNGPEVKQCSPFYNVSVKDIKAMAARWNYDQSTTAASTTTPGLKELVDSYGPEQVERVQQESSAALGVPQSSVWKTSMSFLKQYQSSNANAAAPMHAPIVNTTLGQAQALNQQQQALAGNLWLGSNLSRNVGAHHGKT